MQVWKTTSALLQLHYFKYNQYVFTLSLGRYRENWA